MSIARRRQFWTAVHRYMGLTTLAFLFIAAVTGCFLCFDQKIDAALNSDLFYVQSTGPVLPSTKVIAHLEQARPDLIVTKFSLRDQPGRSIQASVMPRSPKDALDFDQIFLDPHSGQVIGTRQSGPGLDRRHIVETVFIFHYTLLAGKWGRWIMGIAALGWLIGNGIGCYLTLPVGTPFWRKWKRMWSVNFHARLRWLMVDLHRASGLWLLIGLTVLAFTSVAMNFFDEVYQPVASAMSPARPSPFDNPAAGNPQAAGSQPIGFAAALSQGDRIAQSRNLHWQPAVETYLPDRNLYGVMFTPTGYETYRDLGPVTYYVDARTGGFVYADDPYHDSAGRKATRILYPLHSGEVIGPAGTAIIFLLGLATAEMCVSGLYIWWKKRKKRPVRSSG
ncbi:PepSY-associated TM helix domain-containing protein [Stakelama sediminis]|uniref:Putative iron-regulated membrane protein n=1 Tax=Stakelama sediminis TaxID=463200 RepID=A0A840Z383_9SPHN|nr:PepSY-associated TM helix domain-containing protein [Stakelama sediminis]MBB5720333.1 putative iron-regulated membrane protein [Stakelama sediminis]